MIAIKDFKMPENCLRCPMQFGGWCYVSPPEVDERVTPTVDEAWEQGKPDWCPLVEVPDTVSCSEIPNSSEIISCKDCRYSEYDSIFRFWYCHYKGKAELVGDNFFCAAGRYQANGSD